MEGKRRYPTDKQGVPLKPSEIGECNDVCFRPGGPVKDRHHLAWPRDKYRTAVERQYRDAGCMVVEACRCKHVSLHETYNPPPKPDRFTMIDIAGGDIEPTETQVQITRRDHV